MMLQADLKVSNTRMHSAQGDTQLYLEKLMKNQRRLVELYSQEGNIRNILVSIQTKLMPSLEVLKQEIAKVKDYMKEDVNMSTKEGLVDLATRIEIQIKKLEIARSNWVTESSTIT